MKYYIIQPGPGNGENRIYIKDGDVYLESMPVSVLLNPEAYQARNGIKMWKYRLKQLNGLKQIKGGKQP